MGKRRNMEQNILSSQAMGRMEIRLRARNERVGL